MDYAKVEYEVLKNLVGEKIGRVPNKFFWEELDNEQVMLPESYVLGDKQICFTLDGYVAFIVPKCLWFLNTGDWDCKKISGFSEHLKGLEKSEEAHEELMKNNGKEIIKKLVTKNGKFAWVREKLLKPYGKNLRYYVQNEYSPVFVCEGGTLLGFVMPIRHEKEEIERS